MKKTLFIKAYQQTDKTAIYFGSDLINTQPFFRLSQKLGNRLVIISDTSIGTLYGKSLQLMLSAKGLDCSLLEFAPGEEQKNRATKEKIENQLLEAHYGRDTGLIALGGGVVTDLAGFVAATYLRGIPYLSLPTSLIGMVDASIGGKTGINTKWGKNTLGAFYPPRAVFIDFAFLETLPDRERLQGIAEIVKYGLVKQSSLFWLLDQKIDCWSQWDISLMKQLIYKSCKIKKNIIEGDLTEQGKRRSLNFGHTIAHAIEQVEGYQIGHGEALAIGMIVESLISLKIGHLNEKEFDQISTLIKALGFRLALSPKVTTSALLQALQSDKKKRRGQIRFVILDAIGKVASFRGNYCHPIDGDLLDEALSWMVAAFSANSSEKERDALSY